MKKLLVITGLLLSISLSCEQREALTLQPVASNQPQPNDRRSISIEEAKIYFTSTVLPLSASDTKPVKDKYERDILWDLAKKVKQVNDLEVVVAPIKYNTNSKPGVVFWDAQTAEDKKLINKENMLAPKESLLMFRDKEGNIQTQIVQFIASKEYQQLKKGIIQKADFTGWIIALTWDDRLITGFEFKNGKDIKQLTPTNIESSPNARPVACDYTYYQNVTANCYSCGTNCATCDVFVSGGYQGTCTGPSSNSGTDSNYGLIYGGSSGGGGEYSYIPAEQRNYTQADIITDPNLNDCIKGILWKLSTSSMNNYLATEFRKLYGDNSGTRNFYFKAGTLSADAIAQYNRESNSIIIDQSKVGQSSNEFVASVIAHELAHVIITEYQVTGIVPPDQYAQHIDIFENMVLNISYLLTNAYPAWDYPELSANNRQNAIALALGGISDVVLGKNGNIRPEMDQMAVNKYGTTLAQASAIIQSYQNGTKGTKCE